MLFLLTLRPFTYEGTSYFCWKPYRPHDIAQPWLLSWPLTQFNKNFNWSEVVFPCQARLPEPSWLFLAALLSHGISWRKNSVLYSSIFLNVSGRCLHLWFPGPFFSLWFGFSLSLPVLLLFLICYLVLDHLLCKMSVVFGFFFNRPWVKRVTKSATAAALSTSGRTRTSSNMDKGDQKKMRGEQQSELIICQETFCSNLKAACYC